MNQSYEFSEGQRIGATDLQVKRRLDGRQGRMAQVYLAEYVGRSGAPQVVVKIANAFDRQGTLFIDALRNEAGYLAELHHPHIIRLLPAMDSSAEPEVYFGEPPNEGYAYIVLEYLAGGTLRQHIQKHPHGLPIGDAVAIAFALATALDYMHARGLVHMDVAPQNVLMRALPEKSKPIDAVLIDFGSTCRVGRQNFALYETFHASPYMPPEVLAAASEGTILVRSKIDVYSLGAMLYTMLVGAPPFDGKDERMLHAAIERGAYPPLAERWKPDRSVTAMLQERLDKLVRFTMQPDPDRRCDAALMARQLYEIGFHLGLWPAAPASVGEGKGHTGQRSLLIALLVLGILLFGSGFGFGFLVSGILPAATSTVSSSVTPAELPTATSTLTPIPTSTSSATPTASPTSTHTPTVSPTYTSTPTETDTPRAPTATPASSSAP